MYSGFRREGKGKAWRMGGQEVKRKEHRRGEISSPAQRT